MCTMRKTKIRRGTTNVFADLGFPDPEIHFLKAQLMGYVQDSIRRRRLDQVKAARTMGVSAFELSEMLKGQFRETSIEQIIRLLNNFGCDVNLVVKPKNRKRAGGAVECMRRRRKTTTSRFNPARP